MVSRGGSKVQGRRSNVALQRHLRKGAQLSCRPRVSQLHMNHDEHDDLWQLLGKARPPRISPFFSRNVLRAIRAEQPERRAGWLGALWRHWRGASVAIVVLAVFAGVSIQTDHR